MMRISIIFALLLFAPLMTIAQTIELQGTAKVSQMAKVNTADSVVVRLTNGELGVRDVSTLVEHQIISSSNDTIFLSDGGFVKLPDGSDVNELQTFSISPLGDTLSLNNGNAIIIPGITQANYTLQERLDAGVTPCELVDDGVSFNELYGLNYAGGLIFHLSDGGCTGLVAAPGDQSTGAEWGCLGTFIPGANGFGIGTGQQNTLDILAGCSTAGIAADIADSYDDGTYSDWFLPSRSELQEMYTRLKQNGLGDFSMNDYWSSSESQSSSGRAWEVQFAGGAINDEFKDTANHVRAVRSFSDL